MRVRGVFVIAAVVVLAGLSAPRAYAAGPTLTVEPAEQLVDIQPVTITGAGFTPGKTIRVAECLASNLLRCDPFTEAFPTSDASGAFSTTVFVRREIKAIPNSAQITDCGSAPGVCVFFAENISDLAQRAFAPFSFNPKIGPLRIDPSIARKVELTNSGFSLLVRGTVECTLPDLVYIFGFILQEARDPNFGYPFITFVRCQPHRSAWSATIPVNVADLPFRPGKANVHVEAVAAITGFQVFETRDVVLVAR